jgi:hypothetical protein
MAVLGNRLERSAGWWISMSRTMGRKLCLVAGSNCCVLAVAPSAASPKVMSLARFLSLCITPVFEGEGGRRGR